MRADKMSVSLDPDLGEAIREAASQRGDGLSSWMADAAAAKLRADALSDFLDTWEKEHGAFTPAELAEAAADLGLPWPADGPAA